MDIEQLLKSPGVADKIAAETGRDKNSVIYWGRRRSVPAKFLPAVAAALNSSIEEVIAACAPTAGAAE